VTAAKILWGQVLAVAMIVLASVWSATQWTASALGYQAELGKPWFELLGHPVYRPYDLFWWWFAFEAYAPQVFDTGGLIAMSGGFAAIVVAIAMSVWRGGGDPQLKHLRGGRVGRTIVTYCELACSAKKASSLASSTTAICVMTGRNMCCVLRPRVRAKALVW